MKKFRKQLEKQKAILSKRLKKEPIEEQKKPRSTKVPWKFNQRLRQTLLFALAGQQMKDVTNAIERLDEGIYGVCVACGKNIEPNRLEAMPTATHCWDCQHE